MSDNVVAFTGITKLNLDPDRVLNGAVGKLDQVVIVGFDKDGNFYFSGSQADGGDNLWLLRRAEYRLMQIADAIEAGE